MTNLVDKVYNANHDEIAIKLNILNEEYINLINSKEFRLGKSIYKGLSYLKEFRILRLLRSAWIRSIDKKSNKIDIDEETIYNITAKKVTNTCSRIAVYTCITGDYDQIKEPLFTSSKCDYYAITDKPINQNSKWARIDPNRFLKEENLSNIEKNRYFKMHPHILFSEYKYSIYIDGNIRIISDISGAINHISPIGISMHSHSRRDCLYNEAKTCIALKKGNKQDIISQIERYSNEGMPHRYGLFEANMIAREHNNPICIKLMDYWWKEFLSTGKRDQISFPYVLWKNGFNRNDIWILGSNIYKNYALRVENHFK